ncbi:MULTISPECIES: hypothetical protein [Halobacterium]|uniref:Protein VNG_1110C n=4 Tax=Halobacterium salinarum TaxID=2242 RepID=Y1110_HALSA|nr:hypothetical protein [Halobacterium salinarum]P17104.1 RecName: Full=Protein VNG_1110C; AltName: Full=Protein NAB [Halobacterium salinarum NRC-1]AAG19502.1 conserved hypothetical protein [Halobacterium salinarum NRC-1]MBB6090187.1 hypothetical protein [Halobacterium salinarum]MCF2165010.1 hypothetical protein [Halobacterium salinarum]MCF2168653.1 hypothetical protein [Halobacterium salinarum]MDL0119091.1 hypothetical protein [Halobacterium salinarum]
MGDPAAYRDSTQIVLPVGTLEDIEVDLEAEFMVSVFRPTDAEIVRIIGSPVVIKEVTEFLTRHGVHMP